MSDQFREKPSCSGDDQNLHDPATNLDDPNDHLSLHNWIDNSVELERATETNQNANGRNTFLEQIATGLTRVVMQEMPLDENSDETDNAEMTETIGMCLKNNQKS